MNETLPLLLALAREASVVCVDTDGKGCWLWRAGNGTGGGGAGCLLAMEWVPGWGSVDACFCPTGEQSVGGSAVNRVEVVA